MTIAHVTDARDVTRYRPRQEIWNTEVYKLKNHLRLGPFPDVAHMVVQVALVEYDHGIPETVVEIGVQTEERFDEKVKPTELCEIIKCCPRSVSWPVPEQCQQFTTFAVTTLPICRFCAVLKRRRDPLNFVPTNADIVTISTFSGVHLCPVTFGSDTVVVLASVVRHHSTV